MKTQENMKLEIEVDTRKAERQIRRFYASTHAACCACADCRVSRMNKYGGVRGCFRAWYIELRRKWNRRNW